MKHEPHDQQHVPSRDALLSRCTLRAGSQKSFAYRTRTEAGSRVGRLRQDANFRSFPVPPPPPDPSRRRHSERNPLRKRSLRTNSGILWLADTECLEHCPRGRGGPSTDELGTDVPIHVRSLCLRCRLSSAAPQHRRALIGGRV